MEKKPIVSCPLKSPADPCRRSPFSCPTHLPKSLTFKGFGVF